MDKVRCNNCMEIFDERELIYDENEDMEFCPYCGKGGCIMDLGDEELKMKQSECMSIINELFNKHIKANEHIFKSYNYSDHRACDLIVNFKKDVEKSGFKFSKCYHANGIGNNNDYTIYLESHDDDGFVIKKEIANFYYCYGIYGGCSVYIKDLVTGNRIEINCAR